MIDPFERIDAGRDPRPAKGEGRMRDLTFRELDEQIGEQLPARELMGGAWKRPSISYVNGNGNGHGNGNGNGNGWFSGNQAIGGNGNGNGVGNGDTVVLVYGGPAEAGAR
jgi:hypothetical protein